MKFVMVFTVGDNTTWSCQVSQPIEYTNKKNLINDFCKKLMEAASERKYTFKFLNANFYVNNFGFYNEKNEYLIYEPEIYTLDEWFEKTKLL